MEMKNHSGRTKETEFGTLLYTDCGRLLVFDNKTLKEKVTCKQCLAVIAKRKKNK